MKRLLDLYKKNKEIINYIIVGGCTTVVSVVSYYLFRLVLDHYLICTILSWVVSVVFAYITNRIFVFESKDKRVLIEFFKFVFARVLSLLSEIVVMAFLVQLIHIDDRISKIIVQFIILILNYLFSKLFVFKNKSK